MQSVPSSYLSSLLGGTKRLLTGEELQAVRKELKEITENQRQLEEELEEFIERILVHPGKCRAIWERYRESHEGTNLAAEDEELLLARIQRTYPEFPYSMLKLWTENSIRLLIPPFNRNPGSHYSGTLGRLLLFSFLSQNPNLRWEVVRRHPECPWDFDMLSLNPNIPFQAVLDHPEKPWNMRHWSSHPSLIWENVRDHLDLGWDFGRLSVHPCVTWEIVLANPHLPFDLHYLSENPNIGPDVVLAQKNYPWSYAQLSWNKSTPFELVERDLPDRPWLFPRLSLLPSLRWEHVLRHLQQPWDAMKLVQHPNFSWETVQSHPMLRCHQSLFVYNPSLTWKTVRQNRPFWWYLECFADVLPCTWRDLTELTLLLPEADPEGSQSFLYRRYSASRSLRYSEVQTNIHAPWQFEILSRNPVIPSRALLDFPDKPWDLFAMVQNDRGRLALNLRRRQLLGSLGIHQAKEFFYRLTYHLSKPGAYYAKMVEENLLALSSAKEAQGDTSSRLLD